MKASELIKQLEHCIKKAGDREVVMCDPSGEKDWCDIVGTVWPEDGKKSGKGAIVIADRETMESFT